MEKIRKDKTIGDNLRRLRKVEMLSQENVAAKLQLMGLDISRSIYSRYETGTLNIPVKCLIALTEIYHCDYNAFFEGLHL